MIPEFKHFAPQMQPPAAQQYKEKGQGYWKSQVKLENLHEMLILPNGKCESQKCFIF